MKNKHLKLLGVLFLFVSCNEKKAAENKTIRNEAKTPFLSYEIIGEYPHDTGLFTEGLLIHDGEIYESTGSPQNLPFTQTQLGIIDTLTGQLEVKVDLGKKFFGEGISILNGRVYQLTYTSQICFVYDLATFKKVDEYKYSNKEGWGLTNDGTHLIMSDGTYKLTFVNPEDFSKVKEIPVKDGGYGVQFVNELEYVDGFIYANIWQKNEILKIEASTGKVVAKVDFTPIAQEVYRTNPNIDAMNGIAYDKGKDEFLITGKLWPKIYRVRLN
ncbi:MAG: glutamine cyclotransferase [Arcticibacterium sp.]